LSMEKNMLAAILSFFIPGLGQIAVKKQLGKGLFFAFGQLGIVILIAVMAMFGTPVFIMYLMPFVIFCFWLYNVYDAYKNN